MSGAGLQRPGTAARAFRGTRPCPPSCPPLRRRGRKTKLRAASLRPGSCRGPCSRLRAPVYRDRGVRIDLVQDGFGPRDEICRRHDFVDQADAVGLLCADHLPGEDQLQRPALADQPGQALRSPAAGDDADRDLRLAELGGLDGEPDGAGHRHLAAAAERKAIDRRDHRLAEVLDEIEDLLPERLASPPRPPWHGRAR